MLLLGLSMTPVFAQVIQLKGIVSVQNSKINTGQRIYVPGVEIEHTSATNPDVTDSDGQFSLSIVGLPLHIQTKITVIPYGIYKDYLVVNQRDLDNITLGRIEPVGVYICKREDFEREKAQMVGVNMRNKEESFEREKKRLQQELEILKNENDYLSERYKEIRDSLQYIDESLDMALQQIQAYVESLLSVNLDEKDDSYIKAFQCLAAGHSDSVSYYLPFEDLEKGLQDALQLREQSQKRKQVAEEELKASQLEKEQSDRQIKDKIDKLILYARSANLENKHEDAEKSYQLAIEADSLNAKNIFEYANYLRYIHDYDKSEYYYQNLLSTYESLVLENPEVYNSDFATILNNLGINYNEQKNYIKAEECFLRCLEITESLALENPKAYNPDLTEVLNNLGVNYKEQNNYIRAEECFLRCLEIRESLALENPKLYNPILAMMLNNLGVNYHYQNNYIKAEECYLRCLEIGESLELENPKDYNPELAMILNNLGANYRIQKNHIKAEKYYLRCLEISESLAIENLQVFNPDLAKLLYNLGRNYYDQNNYVKAEYFYLRCLEICESLVSEDSEYIPYIGGLLNIIINNYK